MGQYNKAIITAAGESLISRAVAGELKLNITKAKISNHRYPDGTDYKALTDMDGVKQILEYPETKVLDNNMIQTRVLFSNEEIQVAYYIQNIGLYAKDGEEEILFCIVTAVIPDEMPKYNGVASTSYIYNIQNVVQDAAEINIEVVPSGTATIQDVMERVDATGGDISETVIETLETIDAKYPVPEVGDSTKVFMGKVKKYIKDTKPLNNDMFVYVDNNGSDITGDGTSSNPYKTIKSALNNIPKDLGGHSATVRIADGTYNEAVNISNFHSGMLHITRANNWESLNISCNIDTITCISSTARIIIAGINFTQTSNHSFIGIDCSNLVLWYCQAIGDSQYAGFHFESCNARIDACRVNNKKWGVIASYFCRIHSASWYIGSAATDNGIASLSGSTVTLMGNQPTGAWQFYSEYGGVFLQQNGTQISNLTISGLYCPWGNINSGYYRNGNINGPSQINIQTNITTTVTLNANKPYLIAGYPLRRDQFDTVVHTAIPSRTLLCFLRNTSTYSEIYFTSLVDLPAGSNLLFSGTYTTNS